MADTLTFAWEELVKGYEALLNNPSVNDIIVNNFGGDVGAFLNSDAVATIYDSAGQSAVTVLNPKYYSAVSSSGSVGTNIGSVIDSNTIGSVAGGGSVSASPILDITKNETGQLVISNGVKNFSTGLAKTGTFISTEILPAIAAAGAGIALGKIIDKTLYNINPDFWDSRGMEGLNPDTWENITSDNPDAIGNKIFNYVFGIDPANKSAQGYIDENAFAYLAGYMKNNDVFSYTEEKKYIGEKLTWFNSNVYITFTNDVPFYTSKNSAMCISDDYIIAWEVIDGEATLYFALNGSRANLCAGSDSPFTLRRTYTIKETGSTSVKDIVAYSKSYSGKTFYGVDGGYNIGLESYSFFPAMSYKSISTHEQSSPQYFVTVWYLIFNSATTLSPGVSGIEQQEGFVPFDSAIITDASNIPQTIEELKQARPDIWQNAITFNTIDPNGEIKSHIYIPIGTANGVSNPLTTLQPTTSTDAISGTQNNTEIKVDPSTSLSDSSKELLDWITNLLKPNTTPNTPGTGTGGTPIVPEPTGSASALFTVYNPNQSELNAFGSWLWSSNFVEQLKKLFNDPMQAIIGLSKVYASPSISGRNNIKVGYLDSGVSSNVVGNQYTTINCGSVDVPEYFGNILDYAPYTSIHCFLPFIGIVPLNVGDVMRSTVSIIYHVDIITGECLAEINVQRDGNTVGMYTFSGSASVNYPISAGSNVGSKLALLGVVGGAALGLAAGMAGGAVGGILSSAGQNSALIGMRQIGSNVQHGGGFTGNSGAMGGKIPYLIITRPQSYIAENYNKYDGRPENKFVSVSECSGYARFNSIRVDSISGATDKEKNMIENLLKNGIIV